MGDTRDGRDEKGLTEEKRQRERELAEELDEDAAAEERREAREEDAAETELARDE